MCVTAEETQLEGEKHRDANRREKPVKERRDGDADEGWPERRETGRHPSQEAGLGRRPTQPPVNWKARLNRTLRQSKQIPLSLAAPFRPLTLVFFRSPGALTGVR